MPCGTQMQRCFLKMVRVWRKFSTGLDVHIYPLLPGIYVHFTDEHNERFLEKMARVQSESIAAEVCCRVGALLLGMLPFGRLISIYWGCIAYQSRLQNLAPKGEKVKRSESKAKDFSPQAVCLRDFLFWQLDGRAWWHDWGYTSLRVWTGALRWKNRCQTVNLTKLQGCHMEKRRF